MTAQQTQVAHLLYGLATSRGLPPARAREFVSAALAESGLNPGARNRSSGAAGLFQLLSGGYRQRAQQLGGLNNPRANALAILPDYQRYWQQHPGAAPGAAGRDVERSGEGAGFYSRGLAQLPQLGGGAATPQVRPALPPVGGLAAAPDSRPQLAQALIGQVGHQPNVGALVDVLRERARAQAQAEAHGKIPAGPGSPHPGSPVGAAPAAGGGPHGPGGIAELLLEGTGGPTHSTGPHLHYASQDPRAMLAALAQGRRLGLAERENPYVDPVDPVHAPHSYHNRTFPGRYNGRPLGEATDFSGDPARVRALMAWIRQHYRR